MPHLPNHPRQIATDGRGGGQALPPFLQARSPVTQPTLTPKASVVPGEVQKQRPFTPPTLTPQAPPGAPPSSNPPAQSLFEFFKGDLERERDKALSGARADASRRGVFFGSPLTTSQGDIQTEFQRGLGTLQANLLQNKEQNELQRLGLAGSLLGGAPQGGGGGIDPSVFQTIGSLLAPRGGPTQGGPTLSGPAINQQLNPNQQQPFIRR